jgi:hypothetical protein
MPHVKNDVPVSGWQKDSFGFEGKLDPLSKHWLVALYLAGCHPAGQPMPHAENDVPLVLGWQKDVLGFEGKVNRLSKHWLVALYLAACHPPGQPMPHAENDVPLVSGWHSVWLLREPKQPPHAEPQLYASACCPPGQLSPHTESSDSAVPTAEGSSVSRAPSTVVSPRQPTVIHPIVATDSVAQRKFIFFITSDLSPWSDAPCDPVIGRSPLPDPVLALTSGQGLQERAAGLPSLIDGGFDWVDVRDVVSGDHRNISSKKASDELGYVSRPTYETVADTFAWFRAAKIIGR